MKRFSTLSILIGLGVLATGACGSDDDDDNSPSKPEAGHAGRGGTASGASGKGAQAGQAGRAGNAAASGKGGSGGRGGTGAGNSGRGGTGRGGTSRGGTGGSVVGGAGAGGDPGTGGLGGAPGCYAANATEWRDITLLADRGDSATYASQFESSVFQGKEALLELFVFLPDTGTFTLGTGDNANWATCQQCLLARVDEGNQPDRVFFADAGTLKINSASEPLAGVLDANLTNAHFVEVTLDDDYPFTSRPVDGGSCLENVTTHISVDPNAGSGGAGGAGGEGGYAGAHDLPEGCIEVSSGTWISNIQTSFTRYISLIAPNLGSPAEDGLILSFYGNDVGTTRIGHGVDSRFATCERCFLANIQEDGSDGLWFYGVDGTLAVESGSDPMGGIIEATATDVTFTQVDPYDFDAPIDGGECLHLATATISKP